MTSATPQVPPPAPAQKKTSPLVWILVGCGGVVLLAAVVMLVAGVFVAKKVGKYAKDAERNPAMAAAKLAVAMHPDYETVRLDEDAGTMTIRNKKTGEVVTVSFEDVKEGKIRFSTEGGETAEISTSGEGETGKVEIKTDQGSMTFGAGGEADSPDWVPSYAGSSPQGMYSTKGPQGISGAFSFDTSDTAEDVIAFYEKVLKDGGFDVTTSTVRKGKVLSGALINAVAETQHRTVHVTLSVEEGTTKVAVNYTEGTGT